MIEQWLATWQSRLNYVSNNEGCGCCVDIYNIEGPQEAHLKARQVPVEGGSGAYPTGPIQFRNDWPGLFVRGDNALALLYELQATLGELQKHNPESELGWQTTKLMKIIEGDVLL
jgi:hypothetical protein